MATHRLTRLTYRFMFLRSRGFIHGGPGTSAQVVAYSGTDWGWEKLYRWGLKWPTNWRLREGRWIAP